VAGSRAARAAQHRAVVSGGRIAAACVGEVRAARRIFRAEVQRTAR
jgi:hypothetical protein